MFVEINNRKYTLEELAEKLGISGRIDSISLCQEIPSGVLEVTGYSAEDDPYPALDTWIRLKSDNTRIYAARTEQAKDGDPTIYLYGRTDAYLAYLRYDTRPDDEFDAEPRDPVLVVGGDSDFDVQLYTENNFVHWCGPVRDD